MNNITFEDVKQYEKYIELTQLYKDDMKQDFFSFFNGVGSVSYTSREGLYKLEFDCGTPIFFGIRRINLKNINLNNTGCFHITLISLFVYKDEETKEHFETDCRVEFMVDADDKHHKAVETLYNYLSNHQYAE